MVRPWKIYVLRDPRTNEIRYVGVTHSTHRLSEHLYSAKVRKTHTATWIKSLCVLGFTPVLETIEEGKGPGWAVRERFWIAKYKELGCKLTNHTEGGEGTPGWSPSIEQRKQMGERAKLTHTGKTRSDETRRRMRESQLRVHANNTVVGRKRVYVPTPETIAKISKALTGRTASTETRAKLSAVHANPSEVTREKLRAAILKRSPDQRAAFATNQVGKAKSEATKQKMSAARKAYWARKKAES